MDRTKLLVIFAAAWLSAALLTWFLYTSIKTPRVEKTIAIEAAAHDMPAGTRLRKEDLKTVRVTEKDAPKMAVGEEKLALERTLLFPMTANEPVTLSKISSAAGGEGLSSTIDLGMRAISVPINDTSGVSGLIQPRSHVDVLFTKPGSVAEAVTTTILEDVIVLAIGRTTESTSAATTARIDGPNRGTSQRAVGNTTSDPTANAIAGAREESGQDQPRVAQSPGSRSGFRQICHHHQSALQRLRAPGKDARRSEAAGASQSRGTNH